MSRMPCRAKRNEMRFVYSLRLFPQSFCQENTKTDTSTSSLSLNCLNFCSKTSIIFFGFVSNFSFVKLQIDRKRISGWEWLLRMNLKALLSFVESFRVINDFLIIFLCWEMLHPILLFCPFPLNVPFDGIVSLPHLSFLQAFLNFGHSKQDLFLKR